MAFGNLPFGNLPTHVLLNIHCRFCDFELFLCISGTLPPMAELRLGRLLTLTRRRGVPWRVAAALGTTGKPAGAAHEVADGLHRKNLFTFA